MRKVVGIFLLLPVIAVLSLALLGLYASPRYSGTLTAVVPATPEKIWTTLNDVDGLPQRRREIIKIEHQAPNTAGLPQWREYTDLNSHMDFEVTERIPQQKLIVHMKHSTFGMTGVWTYQIKPHANGSEVTIHEDSVCSKIWLRTIMTLSGRDTNLKREMALLR